MEIYVVTASTYEYSNIVSVFSNLKDAESTIKEYYQEDIESEERGCCFKYGKPDYDIEGPFEVE